MELSAHLQSLAAIRGQAPVLVANLLGPARCCSPTGPEIRRLYGLPVDTGFGRVVMAELNYQPQRSAPSSWIQPRSAAKHLCWWKHGVSHWVYWKIAVLKGRACLESRFIKPLASAGALAGAWRISSR